MDFLSKSTFTVFSKKILYIATLFLYTSTITAEESWNERRIEHETNRLKQEKETSERDFNYRQEQDRLRQEQDRFRQERDENRERQRQVTEAREKAQDKCDEVHEKVQEEMEAKKEEKEKWEEKFHDLEEKITDLEKENSDKQVEINEKIDELKTETNETLQEFKDDMAEELKSVDEDIKQLQESMAELNDELYKIEETRLTAFYARRKQQNEFYSTCFTKAMEQTEKERSQFFQRSRRGTLKRKNIGQLMEGGKKQTKNAFSNRFNSFLQLCLNNQAALLKKQNEKNEYLLTLEKLDRQEDMAKAKIKGIKTQIQNMKTTGKVEVMNRFKEKMQNQVNLFSQSYDSLTANHKKSSQQITQQIEKIKQQQAYALSNRAQAIPQETRSALMAHKCEQMNVFNLFPNPASITPTNEGFLGGSGTLQ